ncbi:MAG: hypothetical protein ACRDNT_21655 [Streptosporangiaceae bacterium]
MEAAGPLMSNPATPRSPGLFEVARAGGERAVTSVRRIAGAERQPGSALVTTATVLLSLLAAGLLYVSFSAQYKYIFAAKDQSVPSMIEAGMLDVGMIIFSFLALGLSRQGKSSRTERALIMACAGFSALMNYAASDTASPRSVAAYVAAPVFLAVVADRVIAVVRRYVLGAEEESAWSALGRALADAARLAGAVLLYLLRLVLAPPSTALGLRRWVLVLAPLPETEKRAEQDQGGGEDKAPPELEGASKRARLTWWYERDPAYGDRAAAAAAAKRIAPLVDLGEGTARAYIGAILAGLERAGRAS